LICGCLAYRTAGYSTPKNFGCVWSNARCKLLNIYRSTTLGQNLEREMEHARYFQHTFTTSVNVFVHNSELLRLLTFCLFSNQHRSSGLNRKLRPVIFKSIIERFFLTPELAGQLCMGILVNVHVVVIPRSATIATLLKFKQCLKVAKVKGANARNHFCNSCISCLLTVGTLLSLTTVARNFPYTLPSYNTACC
jgi:hypothetical protein